MGAGRCQQLDVVPSGPNIEGMNLSFLRLRGDRAIEPSGPRTCKEKARSLVHKYAAFGTAWALLPIPGATSLGLTALETHMIYWVGRVYGDAPTQQDILVTAAGLELASVALKTIAIEGAVLVPAVGLGIKASIAGGAIEAIGNAIIQHYEGKYPGRAA